MSPPGSKGSGLGQNQTAQPTGREPDQKLPPERGQDPKPKAARETDQESPRNAEPGKEGESGSTQPGESAPDGERPAAASPPRPPDWDLKTGLQIALLALFLGGALLLARKVKRKRSAKRPPPLRAARRVSRRQRQTALDRLKARCQSLLKGDADERTRRERVILLYNSLLDFLETCGHGKPSHVTPDEFSEQLGAPEPSELSFDAATRIFSRACYGGKGPSPEHYQRFAKNVPRLAESLARLESRAAK